MFKFHLASRRSAHCFLALSATVSRRELSVFSRTVIFGFTIDVRSNSLDLILLSHLSSD